MIWDELHQRTNGSVVVIAIRSSSIIGRQFSELWHHMQNILSSLMRWIQAATITPDWFPLLSLYTVTSNYSVINEIQ